jgi:glutathione S-transferase
MVRRSGLPFDELRIPLFADGSEQQLAEHCPAGLVPVLEDGDRVVWDSLAIGEYLAERCPGLWPADPAARAMARSASAEMHSGFTALRDELPMNCRREVAPLAISDACRAEVTRIEQIWSQLREQFGARGPWLCGRWSIVDAMFAPIVLRLDRYAVPVSDSAAAYIATTLADPVLADWLSAAAAESEVLEIAER